MKYRVTTNWLSGLDKGDTVDLDTLSKEYHDVVERNPDWFEPIEQVREGDWVYDSIDELFRIEGFKNYCGHKHAFGHKVDGGYYDELYNAIKRKATSEEIEQALIKEANRRGFKKGVKCNCLYTEHDDTISHTDNTWEYEKYYGDQLFWLNSTCIYKNGSWAEIIDDEPDIEISGISFEGLSDDGCTLKFSCGDRCPKKGFEYLSAFVNVYDLKVIRHGEDITPQIKEIAEYIENNQ